LGGIAYTSAGYGKADQGTASGSSAPATWARRFTHFVALFLVVGLCWENTAIVYSIVLLVMAVGFWLFPHNSPRLQKHKTEGAEPRPLRKQLEPLKRLPVWRFSLYDLFVFGSFVAQTAWLPRDYTGAYATSLAAVGHARCPFHDRGALQRPRIVPCSPG